MDNNQDQAQGLSPAPEVGVAYMSFPDAIAQVTKGKKIMRESWKPHVSYGLLKDSFLTIFIGGEFHSWLVNDGDMEATDWFVIEDN